MVTSRDSEAIDGSPRMIVAFSADPARPQMLLEPLILDFESYFDKDLTLKKMSTSEYVRDHRFFVHSVSIKHRGVLTHHRGEPAIRAALGLIAWPNVRLIAHNCSFDAFVLTNYFGIIPGGYGCTMFMSRGLLQGRPDGHSLDDLSEYFAWETKPDMLAKLKGLTTIPPELWKPLEEYNNHDVLTCEKLWHKFTSILPERELQLINMTVRMFCESPLEVDVERAQKALELAIKEKDDAVRASGMAEEDLGSNKLLQAKLNSLDVPTPMKFSKKQKKMVPAFAKSDEDFTDLLTHENKTVRSIVAARLQVKSTIGPTRARRMITAGTTGNRKLPVGYGYAAAHTLRDGGTNKINLKNLPRGGELRKSILAPEGHVLVVADSGQIEYRFAHWLGNEQWVLDLLNEGRDPYCESATEMFGYTVDKLMKRERFVGKVRELGLDYGMGPSKFQATLASGAMGMVVDLPLETCQQSVWAWRNKRPNLTGTWKDFDSALLVMAGRGGVMEYRHGIRFDADNGLIWYPNGFFRAYPSVNDWNGITYTRNGRVFNLWGGTLMEHFCQGGCRDIVMEQALNIDKRYKVVMTTYDEIVSCVKEDEADEALQFMLAEMATTPSWAPGLPLKAEGGYAREYSK